MSFNNFIYYIKSFIFPLTDIKAMSMIFVVGAMVYFNALFGAFVVDDFYQVKQSVLIRSLDNLPKFFTGSTFGLDLSNVTGNYYRPLMSTLFSIQWVTFGGHPFYFHFFQIALHIINGILLFLLFRKFFKEKLSLFLSILFLIHPINVESVSYISGLSDPLFFLFGITALLLSIKEKLNIKRSILAAILILCSLLSKESGVLFLIMIIIHNILFRISKGHVVRCVSLILPPFAIYIYLRFFVANIHFDKILYIPIMMASTSERILTIPAILLYYLKTFFFPLNLVPIIDKRWIVTQLGVQFYIPLAIDVVFFLGIIFLGIQTYRKSRSLFRSFLFFGLWFLIGISIYMQIIPLDFTVSDRWFYFPIVGIIGMIGVVTQLIQVNNYKIKNAVIIICVIIISVLSFKSMMSNRLWYNQLTINSGGTEGFELQTYDDYIDEKNIGQQLFDSGSRSQAIPHFINAIRLSPAAYFKICRPHDKKFNNSSCRTRSELLKENFGIEE